MNEPLDIEPIKARWANWARVGLPVAGDRLDLLAEVERLRAELADMVPRNWRGLVAILDVMYPDSTVTEDNEEGLRLFPLLRHLDQARAELARRDQQITAVRELHNGHGDTAGIFPCPTIAALDGTP